MTILDLVFLECFLLSLIAFVAAAYAAIRGHVSRAFSILGIWLACAILYLGVSVSVPYAVPQRVIAIDTPWCFDDWCLTVKNVQHADMNYNVDMLISSEAKRVTQRAKGPGSTCGMKTIAITSLLMIRDRYRWMFFCNRANRLERTDVSTCPRRSMSWAWLQATEAEARRAVG
jgi:hypothetical protein